MKKKKLIACLLVGFCTAAFAGCSGAAVTPQDGVTAPTYEENFPVKAPEKPVLSPYAALDKIDTKTAFADDGNAEWSFGLRMTADLGTDVSARWYSEAKAEERFYITAGAFLTADDTLGLRRGASGERELFGGGQIALGVRGAAPSSSSPVKEKKIGAGLYHDGGWIVLRGSDGGEKKIQTEEVASYLAEACESGMLVKITETAGVIPESLAQGNLKIGVEKLVSLGFETEIVEEGGVKVYLRADVGLFTDWLNDALEEILPEAVLRYMPRLDLRYRSDLLEFYLAFDEAGAFEEYSMSSNVAIETELRVRGLFTFTCGYGIEGGFELCRADGVPEAGETV